MTVFRTTKMAFKSILHNKMRSFLTMLGIIIGVCSVITLVSVIQGAQRKTMEAYSKMGTNLISVYYGSWGASQKDITEDFFEKCTQLNDYILGVTSSSSRNLTAKYKSKTLADSQVYLASDTFDICMNTTLAAGRTIGYSDIKNRVKVCVLGSYTAKEFFGLENPIGKQIKLNGIYYTVIGTYQSQYDNNQYSRDNMIAVPRTCARSLGFGSSSDNDFTVKCRDKDSTQMAMYYLNDWLKTRLPQNSSYFGVYSDNSWMEQEENSLDMFTWVVAGIAGISLLVGGIGIMNIMLVSVAERTREIGIRMSIGARRRDIITQFLIEASVLSACGGVIGILIGALGSAMLSSVIFQEVYLPSPFITLVAFAFSVVLGIFFGFYPANKASKMQPVEALRNT
ncbi:MAG: ABC transporter permease [Clostridia bacterium]|nr:ABC transporter permease [Clostridia bacterium]